MKEEIFGYSLLLIVRKNEMKICLVGSFGACHSLTVSSQCLCLHEFHSMPTIHGDVWD